MEEMNGREERMRTRDAERDMEGGRGREEESERE